jgi:hypothetical protein
MSDNTTLNPGAGGDVVAADDVGGIKYQRVKLTLGADGVNDGDLSLANPMPVLDSAAALRVDPLAAYALNDVEDASPMYLGKAKASGTWLVQRYSTAGEMRYANISNNSGTASYATAWTNRAALIYGTIQTLTGL